MDWKPIEATGAVGINEWHSDLVVHEVMCPHSTSLVGHNQREFRDCSPGYDACAMSA